jgi:hypothetical protein
LLDMGVMPGARDVQAVEERRQLGDRPEPAGSQRESRHGSGSAGWAESAAVRPGPGGRDAGLVAALSLLATGASAPDRADAVRAVSEALTDLGHARLDALERRWQVSSRLWSSRGAGRPALWQVTAGVVEAAGQLAEAWPTLRPGADTGLVLAELRLAARNAASALLPAMALGQADRERVEAVFSDQAGPFGDASWMPVTQLLEAVPAPTATAGAETAVIASTMTGAETAVIAVTDHVAGLMRQADARRSRRQSRPPVRSPGRA